MMQVSSEDCRSAYGAMFVGQPSFELAVKVAECEKLYATRRMRYAALSAGNSRCRRTLR